MVEKIVVAPNEVRGYGNIVDNDKDKSDLCFYNSFVNADTDLIDGIRIGIMRMIYQDPNLFFSFHQLEKYLYVNSDDMTLSFDSTNKCLVFDDTTESFSLGFDSTDKVLYIGETGEHDYSIAFSQSSYTASGGSATLEITLLDSNVPVQSASVTVTGSDSSSYTGITNSTGVAEVTVTGISGTVTFTGSYSNVSAQCTVTGQTYLFYDSGVTGTANTNYTKSTTGVTATVTNTGTTVTSTTYSDSYYIANVLLPKDWIAEFKIVAVTQFGGIAFLNSSKTKQWQVEYDLYASPYGLKWYQGSIEEWISNDSTMGKTIKLKKQGTNLEIYLNDTLLSTKTITDIQGYLGWKTHSAGNRSVTFKEFKVEAL